jgi:hypothetical protein
LKDGAQRIAVTDISKTAAGEDLVADLNEEEDSDDDEDDEDEDDDSDESEVDDEDSGDDSEGDESEADEKDDEEEEDEDDDHKETSGCDQTSVNSPLDLDPASGPTMVVEQQTRGLVIGP